MGTHVIALVVNALVMAFAMGWEILWPLILGFALSAIVQAVVSHSEMSRLLPDGSPRSIAIALGLGAASSSCSYAAVALARSIFARVQTSQRPWRSNWRPPTSSLNSALSLSCSWVGNSRWRSSLARPSWSPSLSCCSEYFCDRISCARRMAAYKSLSNGGPPLLILSMGMSIFSV